MKNEIMISCSVETLLHAEKRILENMGAHPRPSEHDLFLLGRAQKWARVFQWIPGVRMIGVGNSVAFFASNPQSDIDFFIVTSPKTLWFVRCMTTALATIAWQRMTVANKPGNICLSFFCTTEALDFSQFTLPEGDPYLFSWIRHLKVIYDRGNTYELLCEHNANWAPICSTEKEQNLQWQIPKKDHAWHDLSVIQYCTRSLDRLCRALLAPKTLRHFTSLGRPYGVIVTDTMLKFHDQDRRKEFAERFL